MDIKKRGGEKNQRAHLPRIMRALLLRVDMRFEGGNIVVYPK